MSNLGPEKEFKFTSIESDLFNAFQPMKNFPPRTKNTDSNGNYDMHSRDNLESGILLRDAVNTALNNLSLDQEKKPTKKVGKKYIVHSDAYDYEPCVANKEWLSQEEFPVPVMFPLGWAREQVLVGGEKKKRGVGVNHLNLIQIMGRTAHNWQPFLLQDFYNVTASIVRRPLACIEVNNVLLSSESTK